MEKGYESCSTSIANRQPQLEREGRWIKLQKRLSLTHTSPLYPGEPDVFSLPR